MEAVYFAFGLLALALILGFFLKRSAPKDAALSERAEAVSLPAVEKVTPAQDDYSHITALRESVATRQQQEREVGSVMLSSGVNSDAHEHIREMVARLQSLSGTPRPTSSTLENV
jgi:hypothetical protein